MAKQGSVIKKVSSSAPNQRPANTFVRQPQPTHQFTPVHAPAKPALPPGVPTPAWTDAQIEQYYGAPPGSAAEARKLGWGQPQAQALPLDPSYELEKAQAAAEFQQAAAGIEYQRGRVKQEFGFDDVSNPYNRAAMLQRSFEQSQNQNLNTMAAQGQLYAGATQSVLDEGEFQRGRSYDATRREYDDLLQGLSQAEAQAKAGLSSASSAAALERTQRALETRPVVAPQAPVVPQVAPARPAAKRLPANTFVKKPAKPKQWKPVRGL